MATRLAPIFILFVAGCHGTIDDVENDPTTLPTSPEAPLVCDEAIDPGQRTPLRRLTRSQYNNAVRDLLGVDSRPAAGFPAEESIGGVLVAGPVDSTMFEHYQLAARRVAAEAALTSASERLECGSLTGIACAQDFISRFATLAFRRSLADAELEALMAFYELADGFEEGIALVIEVVLQSPHFLYRPEFSEVGGVRPLNGIERASRLSFFLWNSIPDQELLDAAIRGDLDEGEGVSRQAARMVEDRRAVHAVRSFFRNWFDLDLSTVQKSEELIADFDSLREAVDAEFDAFIEHLMFDSSGTLEELLTTNVTFVNEVTAPYYGLDAARFGPEMERVELDPTQRRGILTMLPVLIDHSAPDSSSPILRGVFIRRNLLCGTLIDPPDEIEVPMVEEGVSERERLAQQRESPICAGCHVRIDHLGLPFESFDALGRFRTTEDGRTIDTSGEIGFTETSDSPIVDALDLAEHLAVSEDVMGCATQFFFQSANGRFPGARDACAVQDLTDALRESGGSLSDLIVALVRSDPFLYQDNTEVSP